MLAENEARHEMGDPLKLSYAAFCERLKALKERREFLRAAHSQPLQQTLRDPAGAYRKAFDPNLAVALPTLKRKGFSQGLRFPQGFKVERNGMYLPKIGWVAFRVSARTAKRKIAGEIKNVAVRLEAGRWYVSFQTEREVPEPVHSHAGSAVGIDLGVTRFAALSDGTFHDGANAFRKHARRLARLQRLLARKVKFSANRRKVAVKITTLHARIANIRKDQIRKSSATISKNHAVVVLEDLRITNMSASAEDAAEEPGRNAAAESGLNRRILDQGWGELRRQLNYKLAWKGGTLILADPRTTSRTCNACGHVCAENRRTQSGFACMACGHASNADTNAAKNIVGRAGLARIACGDSPSGESMKQEALLVA